VLGGTDRYLKKEVIGNGGFARCHLMVNTRTGEKVAGKVIRKRELR
jgi:serine/threonine protein kinase